MQEQSEEQPHNMFHSLNQQQVLQMYGEQTQNENFENDSESNYDAFQDARVVKTVRSLKR